MDCTIRVIPTESLKKYYKPDEITPYCQHCPRYGLNWSCPPHSFSVTDTFTHFRLAYVIGVKVLLSGFTQKAESLDYYHKCRHAVNQRLLQYEQAMPAALVLIAGHCDICDPCARQVSLACNFPDQQRYSFESLGFKVSEMMADIFDDKLQWDKDKTPDNLYLVSGILSNSTIETDELRQILTGQAVA